VKELAAKKMQEYYDKAYKNLDSINVPEHKKLQLRAFADMVSKRAK
jgi:geranylgeranyl pyrophosphate synthase